MRCGLREGRLPRHPHSRLRFPGSSQVLRSRRQPKELRRSTSRPIWSSSGVPGRRRWPPPELSAKVLLVEREDIFGGTRPTYGCTLDTPRRRHSPRDLRVHESQPARRHPCRLRQGRAAAGPVCRSNPTSSTMCPRSARGDGPLPDASGDHVLPSQGGEGDRPGRSAWYPGKHLVIEANVHRRNGRWRRLRRRRTRIPWARTPTRYNGPAAPADAKMTLNGMTLCYRITEPPRRSPICRGYPGGPLPARGPHRDNAQRRSFAQRGRHVNGNAVLCTEYSQLMREGYRRVLEHFHWLQTLAGRRQPIQRRQRRHWCIAGVAPRIASARPGDPR